ncbi:MAG: hypothetical protein ACJ07L_16295 [Opitutales bacterium]
MDTSYRSDVIELFRLVGDFWEPGAVCGEKKPWGFRVFLEDGGSDSNAAIIATCVATNDFGRSTGELANSSGWTA